MPYDHGAKIAQRKKDKQARVALGARIRKLRETKGLSRYEFSRRSGVANSTIFEIEAGHTDPTLTTLRKLARVLGLDLSGLLQGL